jgi:hypothetical protein
MTNDERIASVREFAERFAGKSDEELSRLLGIADRRPLPGPLLDALAVLLNEESDLRGRKEYARANDLSHARANIFRAIRASWEKEPQP